MLKYTYFIAVVSFLLITSCAPESLQLETDQRLGRLPERIVHPINNAPSEEKITLGKNLFWDPILSGNKDVACVTCHHPQHGYAEQLDISLGVGGAGISESRINGTLVQRNSMTILNTAYNGIKSNGDYSPEAAAMFWDSRNRSLEEQAIQPILSAEEMRGIIISEEAIIDTVLQRLRNIPAYQDLFTAAFGKNSINEQNIGRAIAAFERTLTANQSRFDKYVDGDESALSSTEIRGMINFMEVGCINCHNGPMFSDYQLHVLTVPENPKLDAPDEGDGTFAFRTPSLRNLGLTAPYMHNGAFNSLEEVLEFYDGVNGDSQNQNIKSENRDTFLSQLNLPDDKEASIIAFLNSLNDENFDKEILKEVPSKLPPGGNIE